MATIHVLDETTINKIAAGEVVERPASVIKELIENSIDASATNIEVEIGDGGVAYMRITDNGIGMTKDEVDEYINQIAFSGAEAFLEKYKDKANDDQIIGHFGLGFYSAFMVADQVTIDTLSFKDGAESVHWSCDGGTEYDISEGTKTTPGTEITLYLNEDSYEFANEYKAKEVLDKYCSFMPVPIFVTNEDAGEQTEEIPEEEVTEKDTVLDNCTPIYI